MKKVFYGWWVGSVDRNSVSFWTIAQAATGRKFSHYVKKMGIVGEINNQIFDEFGNNRTAELPGLSKHLVNVLSLDDIRGMAGNFPRHKVVMIAAGEEKTRAMCVALRTGLANILITGRDDADRLLKNDYDIYK